MSGTVRAFCINAQSAACFTACQNCSVTCFTVRLYYVLSSVSPRYNMCFDIAVCMYMQTGCTVTLACACFTCGKMSVHSHAGVPMPTGLDEDCRRRSSAKGWYTGGQSETAFSDAFPFLVTCQVLCCAACAMLCHAVLSYAVPY